jgi:hypothetical protein
MSSIQSVVSSLPRAKLLALASGIICQLSFFGAVLVMAIGLHGEMRGVIDPRSMEYGVI